MDQRLKSNEHKLLIICGPTATGKTELAVNIAKQFNGELISADSRQVYKGMDIGTGKDLPKNAKFKNLSRAKSRDQKYSVGFYAINEISTWLLDVVDPSQSFNVAEYQLLAREVIEDIWKRNKLPILVGGTGLYIKAVVDGIETTGIPQDWELRKKLEALPLNDLQEELKRLDIKKWESLNNSDRNNPRRLIRAIEITQFKKKPNHYHDMNYDSKTNADTLMIGLTTPNKILYQRIDERVEKRVKQGIIEEIQALLKKGYSWDLPSMSGLGYRVWKDFFDKKATKEEVVQRWKYQEHAYARRQLTWFRKDNRITWFDITSPIFSQQITQKIQTWFPK